MTTAAEEIRDSNFNSPELKLLSRISELLEEVKDPEIPVLSIRDLGVLRAVEIEGGVVRVQITPTYSGCPAMKTIEDDIRSCLDAAGFAEVQVQTRLAPAWSSDWITAEGREALRAYGIAPPARSCECADGATHQPACPHCGAQETRRISEFGSTACKALHQCLECQEPFDYFKCI